MESVIDLIIGFRYDRWANALWIETLLRKGSFAEDLAIMQHILAAQEMWLSRCQGNPLSSMPTPELNIATLDRLNAQWLKILAEESGNPTIVFKRITGEAHQLP